jgi:hypothetical protein
MALFIVKLKTAPNFWVRFFLLRKSVFLAGDKQL